MGLVDADVGGAANDFGISYGGGAVHFGVGGTSDHTIHVRDVAVNKWHHVAATRVKSTGRMELYVDGVLGAYSATHTTASLTASDFINVG